MSAGAARKCILSRHLEISSRGGVPPVAVSPPNFCNSLPMQYLWHIDCTPPRLRSRVAGGGVAVRTKEVSVDMMKGILFLLPGVLVSCATLGTLGKSAEPTPDEVLESARTALERRDYTNAYDQLSRLYRTQWSTPVGERALLAMTAIELDPRNPGRRLDAGAVLAGQHPTLPAASAWHTPVSETLYHLAMEVASVKERVTRLEYELETAHRERDSALAQSRRDAEAARSARAEAAKARATAASAREALARAEARARSQPTRTVIREVEREAPAGGSGDAALRRERDRLATELENTRAQLAESEAELARIRQTLTPSVK